MRRLLLVASLLVGAAPARARGTCTIEGKAVQPFVVEVAPKEVDRFRVRVSHVAATITPGGIGAPATVHVKAPLVFDGFVDGEIPARTRRPTEALNGMLRLAQATEKLTLHANVRARIVDAEVRLGGIVFRGLALPCEALTLDAVPDPEAKLWPEHPDAPRFVAAGPLLHFRHDPNAGTAMEVALDDADELELRQTEASGEWLHVTSEWPDGTLLIGWVKRSELKPAGMAHERIGDLPRPAPSCAAPSLPDAVRTAVVAIKSGTQVFATRYLGAWARVVDGAKVTVHVSPKDDWIQIVQIGGVDGVGVEPCAPALDNAWIPRAAAALPTQIAGGEDKAPPAAGTAAH